MPAKSIALRKSRDKDDDPMSGFMSGSISVAVGTSAVIFAKRSFNRTTREMTTINKLWKENQTIG